METISVSSKLKNILFVDNDKGFIQDVEDYLNKNKIKEKYGLEFHFARDVREATKELAKLKIDLVISEIVLPVVNGYYLLNILKSKKISAIVYTMLKNSQDLSKIASFDIENLFNKDLTKIEDLIQFLGNNTDYKADLDRVVSDIQAQVKSMSEEEGKTQVKMLQCPRCHTILGVDSHFCNNCGQKIVKPPKKIKLKSK
jgi:CheY-like chemotaxis protein